MGRASNAALRGRAAGADRAEWHLARRTGFRSTRAAGYASAVTSLARRAATADVPLRCRCGALRGVATGLSPRTGNRAVCYCDDCQAYAHFLGRTDVLDAHGGTDIFQITPSQVRITDGADRLRCMRLSENGLMRWYAGCCDTPLGNPLASARVPFVGVVHAVMDHAGDGRSRDEVLGKPRGYIYGRFAVGGLPRHAHPTAPIGMILRALGTLVSAAVRGKHGPSPFFDGSSGQPVTTPRVLSADERESLRQRVRTHAGSASG